MFLKIISSISTNNFQDPNMMEKLTIYGRNTRKKQRRHLPKGFRFMQFIMIMPATTRVITACRSVVCLIKKTGTLTLQSKLTKYLRWIQVIQKVAFIPGSKFGGQKKQENCNVSIVLILKNMIQIRQYLSLSLPPTMGKLSN